ncbi:MAG TPA: hypothetical protein VER79_01945 [Candidatus Limnocylindrales bacterium]|nr:hypothetical protein [Candidatus Limnocylindrales bacterium]
MKNQLRRAATLIFRPTTSRYTDFMNHLRPEVSSSAGQADALVEHLRARGLAGPVAALLDALAPLAPMGAQALYVAQPLAGLASPNWRSLMGDLASVLEMPGGVAALRAALLAPADSHGD